MTIVEKILARASGQKKVSPGEYVTARIDMALMNEMIRLIQPVLAKAGIREEAFTLWDPERLVVGIDHRVPPTAVPYADHQKRSREFAKKLGIKYFYDVAGGVAHQFMVEKGHVKPGELIVGTDSHTTTYGALNAAGTGIGASEMAYVIHTGELWFRVPETILFEIKGKLPELVLSKDVVLSIAGTYTTEIAQYKAIEWKGSVVDEMSLDGRLAMGNMSVELGAKFGLFKADQKVIDYVKARSTKPFTPVDSDPDAVYAERYQINGSEIEPQVALPHSVGNVKKASEVKNVRIDQAVIASCTNGRMEDLEIAAKILKGRKIHSDVRFYVAPPSWEVYREAMDKGILSTLLDSGAMIGNASCGFCTGYQGVLSKGERCIASTPRNFKGRMGSTEAEIYLASAATVAASALKGQICDPREVL